MTTNKQQPGATTPINVNRLTPGITFNTIPSPQATTGPYPPLQFATDPPSRALARRIAQRILNDYFTDHASITAWERTPGIAFKWSPDDTTPPTLTTTTYEKIVHHLITTR